MDPVEEDIDSNVEENLSDEVFTAYRHREIVSGCLPHPGDVVESSSLAAVEGPLCFYPIQESIPQDVIKTGKLSSLQLESIVYSCQRHLQRLPDGSRAGFFIGDSAGVGKGRQIAGIVFDNYVRGRTKHIWFSISTDLIVDAKRDLKDIGCYIKVIDGCNELDKQTKALGLTKECKDGVLFSTYSTLVSSGRKAQGSSRIQRLDQLIAWCGGAEFDGCLIFDECHKAKNFVPDNEQASTKIATVVMNIQRQLPNARVVYCSATGVSDVNNMAFMERMGLWGQGTNCPSFSDFLHSIQKRGLGIAEMLAMDMKITGLYVSRSLSFKQAEFVTVEVTMTEDQVAMYNKAVKLWEETKRCLVEALNRTGTTNQRLWSFFWSTHQRFFKQMCLGIKVDTIVQTATEALENNQCIVIGLQSTGESSLQTELGSSQEMTKGIFQSTCREILMRFIEQFFPTVINSNSGAGNNLQPAGDQSQDPVVDQWCCEAKETLLKLCKEVVLPACFLDELIDRLGGTTKVAEMTGRRGRVVRKGNGVVYETRCPDDPKSLDGLNIQERNSFMTGKKLVAIISDAASTGISLHADATAKNQRRRVHLTVELPWSADKAVQQLGRSHRSNQTSGPLFKLMMTSLGGEKRFASAVARRLQSLGALTKGDRRAATGANLSEFDLDTNYGRQALKSMYEKIVKHKMGVPGLDCSQEESLFAARAMNCLTSIDLAETGNISTADKVKERDIAKVSKFLNRILGLRVKDQNMLFDHFLLCLKTQVESAKKEGRYNEGFVDLVASSIELVSEREVFGTKSSSGGTDSSKNPVKHLTLSVDRGMPWEEALNKLESNPHGGENNGFYKSSKTAGGGSTGHHRNPVVLAVKKNESANSFKIAKPHLGLSAFDEEAEEFLSKHVMVETAEAESSWREHYERSATTCFHGVNCKNSSTCTIGTRFNKVHLLTGGIMQYITQLELVLNRWSSNFKLTKSEMSMKVIRALMNDGRRVIGLRYPQVLISIAEKTIREEIKPQNLSDSQDCQQSTQTEPVRPVIARLLRKAVTPPLTIKSFFKNTNTPIQQGRTNGDAIVDTEHDRMNVTPTSSPDESLKEEPSENTPLKFQDDLEPANYHKKPSLVKNANKRQLPDNADTVHPRSAKRAKQSSLADTFLKMGQKKPPQAQEMKCPICGHAFASTASSTEVNKHIDNCIIE